MLHQDKGSKRLQKQGGTSGDTPGADDQPELDALDNADVDDDEADDPNALDSDLHLADAPVIAAPTRDTPPTGRASRAARERAEREKKERERAERAKTANTSKPSSRASNTKPSSSYNPMMTRSAASRRAEREARRRSITQMGDESARTPIKTQLLDQDKITELLHNPTRFVSEDELRQEYSYVIADIRSMGILTGSLIVLMIVLAQILPR